MLSKTERHSIYSIALLLSNSKRKTFESLGTESGISGDTISRIVTENITSTSELISTSQRLFRRKKVYLLIDDTLILKVYSRFIEGTADHYSSSDGRQYRSLNSVVAMLTDGIIVIPIAQKIWTSREFDQTNYKESGNLHSNLFKRSKKISLCVPL